MSQQCVSSSVVAGSAAAKGSGRRGRRGVDVKRMRSVAQMNQTLFWEQFGITQSGGSRYEAGRSMPVPTQMLMLAVDKGFLSKDQLTELRKLVG